MSPHLPRRAYEQIEVEGHAPFRGRWLAQYFDRAFSRRYSLGETPDGRFFVLCLYDADRHLTLDWFRDAEAVWQSDLAAGLKRAAKSRSGVAWNIIQAEKTPHTINPETGIWPMSEWGSECSYAPPKTVSHRPSPTNDAPPASRLRAICGATTVEIRRGDMGRWYLFVRASSGEFLRQRNFQTCFEDHARRTAEAWYGPATDGWSVVMAEESPLP